MGSPVYDEERNKNKIFIFCISQKMITIEITPVVVTSFIILPILTPPVSTRNGHLCGNSRTIFKVYKVQLI